MLTYKECKEICDTTNNDSIFNEYKYEIDNYKIYVFCYRKEVTKQDFTKSEYEHIREFRGITFVHNLDNTLYKRYIMLPKIFNYSEIEDNLYDNLKDKCLKKVYKKEDGSFISFIRLPNGKLVAKTKASFDDPMCDMAQTFINNNPIYKDIINEAIDNDIQLFFEYVSYKRRIVVDYKSEDLILINIRDNNTGEFLNLDKYRDKISVTNEYTYNNILEIIDECQILEDTEGFVCIFDNDIVKFKTKWYYNNHKMLMDENLLEHMIVKLYLTGYIDDILAKLNSDYKEEKVKIEYIENIISIVHDKRKYLKKELLDIFDNYTDSKELSLSSIDNEIKQLALNTIRYKENIDNNITEHILRMTKRKEMAIKYLKLY